MTDAISNDRLAVYQNVINAPRVPLTLRIGLAGHRRLTAQEISYAEKQIKLLIETIAGELAGYIDPAVDRLNSSERIHYRIASSLYRTGKADRPVLRLTSSLAVGAERLGMHTDFFREAEKNVTVERAAILPFAKQDYRKDFLNAESLTKPSVSEVDEFDHLIDDIEAAPITRLVELNGLYTTSVSREEAYYHCAEVFAENCDLIIAVYDETRCKVDKTSRKAGTKATIDLALKAKKTVIKIDPRGLTASQVMHLDGLGRREVEEIATSESLSRLLERIVLFGDIFRLDKLAESGNIEQRSQAILNNADEYLNGNEAVRCSTEEPDFDYFGPIRAPFKLSEKCRGFVAFNWFRQAFFRKNLFEKIKSGLPGEQPDDFETNEPLNSDIVHLQPDEFYSHFLLADQVAIRYASIHRSTYLLIYLLAAIALLSAGVGAIFKDAYNILIAAVVVKVLSLLAIYLLYKQDAHNHHKWLQSRCLAEAIRPNIYLSLLGRCFSLLDRRSSGEFMYREVLGHGHTGGQWICMHSEAVTRHTGFKHCQLNNTQYRAGAVRFLKEKWLGGQVDYHKGNAARMKQLGETLSGWTHGLFYLTAIFLVIKAMFVFSFPYGKVPGYSMWYYPSKFATLATLLFPIIGTSLFAIRNHAEFDISAQRSLTMLAFFNSMKALFERYISSVEHESEDQASHLDEGLKRLGEMSAQEVADWLEIYEVKESEPG